MSQAHLCIIHLIYNCYFVIVLDNKMTVLCCYFRYLQSAKKSIDLCVYTVTCSELADVIVKLNKLGVQVRVITDSEQQDASGSQVGYFRLEG